MLSRESYRNPPEIDQVSQALHASILEIAHARRRFGYRHIHDLLRPQYPDVNHKKIYRLYSAANLAVRKRKKVKRPASERVPLQLASAVNEVWSMDFLWSALKPQAAIWWRSTTRVYLSGLSCSLCDPWPA